MIIQKATEYLLGSREIEAEKCDAEKVLNFMLREKTDFRRVYRMPEGELRFTVLERDWKRLEKCSEGLMCPLKTIRRHGLPYLIFRYRFRPGLLIGAVLTALVLYISTLFVWDITVRGSDEVSDVYITQQLEKLGFSVGTFIPSVDLYKLCNEYLTNTPEIAWISVNMRGTTAHVEVIENVRPGEGEYEDGTPSNLVAERDGVVVSFDVPSGSVVISAETPVKAGQLLVSGIVENERDDGVGVFTLTRSYGKVYARTLREYTVEIPLETAKKTVAETLEGEKTLKIFGKSIKVSKNSGNLPAMCDRIETVKRLILFEDSKWLEPVALPVFLYTETVVCYEEIPVTLTPEEAEADARAELRRIIAEELPEMELLSERITVGLNEDGSVLTLDCAIECIENIAQEKIIGIKDLEPIKQEEENK